MRYKENSILQEQIIPAVKKIQNCIWLALNVDVGCFFQTRKQHKFIGLEVDKFSDQIICQAYTGIIISHMQEYDHA